MAEIQVDPVDDQEEEEQKQVDPAPAKVDPEPTLEDEIELMSVDEARAFAKRTLKDRRDGNAEAVKAKKLADAARAELDQIKADQASVKREAELAAMDEKDRNAAELADARNEARIERERNVKLQADNAVIGIATRLNFNDPGDAAKLIDLSAALINGVVNEAILEAQVTQLAQDRKYLVKSTTRAFEQPATRPSSNPAPAPTGMEHLQTTKKTDKERQQEFRAIQDQGGPEGALNTAKYYRRLAASNPDIASGKWMDDAMKIQGRKDRDEGG